MARKRRRKSATKRKKRKGTKRRKRRHGGHVPLAILERRERKLRRIIKSRGGSVS